LGKKRLVFHLPRELVLINFFISKQKASLVVAISSPVLLNLCPDMARVYNWEVKKRQALKAQTEK